MDTSNFRVTANLHASKGQRFLNYFLDRIIFYGAILSLIYVVSFVLYTVLEDTTFLDTFFYEVETLNQWVDRIITAIVFSILYMVSEIVMKGRSLAKFITKTKVVMEDGSIPKASDIIKRSLCRMIPFNAFSFLNDETRGWHDSMSETYVVDIEKFEAKRTTKNDLEMIGQPIID